jgi:hypothetical protein
MISGAVYVDVMQSVDKWIEPLLLVLEGTVERSVVHNTVVRAKLEEWALVIIAEIAVFRLRVSVLQ